MYGKIQQIIKTNGTIIKYSYDPSGNRISKILTSTIPAASGDSTYYVRDAGGNVMSVYNKKNAFNLVQKELPIYGSSRLGVYNVAVDVQNCPYVVPSAITIFTRGSKFFELSNHLGNVLATITDKKVQHTTDGTSLDYYTAEVSSATDYYPFGMQMPGRNGSVTGSGSYTPTTTTSTPPITAVTDLVVNNRPTNTPAVYEATNSITFEVNFASTTGDIFEARILEVPEAPLGGNTSSGGVWSSGEGGVYRYGFNGQEKSDDVTLGNTTAEYWEYDSRIGRRWNPDPVVNIAESRYATFGNNPIYYSDHDGDFKTKFGAQWYKFLHGEKGEVGQTGVGKRAGEWSISRSGGIGKKGDGKGDLDEVIVVNPIYGSGLKLDNTIYNAQSIWNSVEFTSQTNIEVNVGLQAGVNFKVNNFINLKAEGGLITNKLIDFKADAYHIERSKVNFGFEIGQDNFYLQKNYLNIGIEAGISKTALSANLGYDYIETEKYYNGFYGPRTVAYETNKGWNGNMKLSPFKSKETQPLLTNNLSGKVGVNTEKKFYGLDVGASVKLIFGVKCQMKIGFQKK